MADPTILESGVTALLGTVTGIGTVYGMMAPQNARPPFTIYQRIDGERFGSMTGPSGLAQARIQVDHYALSYLAAKTGAETIRQRLDGYCGTIGGVRIGGVSLLTDLPDQVDIEASNEAGQPAFRCSKDYLFTYGQV